MSDGKCPEFSTPHPAPRCPTFATSDCKCPEFSTPLPAKRPTSIRTHTLPRNPLRLDQTQTKHGQMVKIVVGGVQIHVEVQRRGRNPEVILTHVPG